MPDPLDTPDRLAAWLTTLIDPVAGILDVDLADARSQVSGAHYSARGAAMESVTRPLWGALPLMVGGRRFEHHDRWVAAIANGVDPTHRGYWGTPGHFDQRWVEACVLGVMLAWGPRYLWDHLNRAQRDHLVAWLEPINRMDLPDNNWLFFRVMVNLGLRRVGRGDDVTRVAADLDRIDSFYLGDGWYSDGPNQQRDYYIPTGMHFYGLLYAMLAGADVPERSERYRRRASAFVSDYLAWFGSDGPGIAFGRSLTYRFVAGCMWPMLALSGVEGVDWGLVRGAYQRHMSWWASKPITTRAGHLSIGFGYANANMAESYNAAGSPYWAFKSFAALAIPAEHPFWSTEPKPLPDDAPPKAMPHARIIVDRVAGQARCVCAGQWAGFEPRHTPAKYAKFAYSSALALSVPHGSDNLHELCPDNTLALSEDGKAWRVRGQTFDHVMEHTWCASTWRQWSDVTIRTWLAVVGPWHVRVHRIDSPRSLHSAEGGWAIPHADQTLPGSTPKHDAQPGRVTVVGDGWRSSLIDLLASRKARAIEPAPNTNLIHPRTVLPLLLADLSAGQTWLASAARADAITPAPPKDTSPRLHMTDTTLTITAADATIEIVI